MARPSGTSKHRCYHKRREARQDRADARQAERNRRTTAQQIARLDSRPGNSTRERARLEAA